MKALLLIDIQRDFLPGGALGVPKGDEILPVVNKLLQQEWDLVVASKDWHPEGHSSFEIWPPHCVQGTKGAELAIDEAQLDHIVEKGTHPDHDAYSAFKETGLAEFLRQKGVTELTVAGLATDYCVKASVLDALAAGFSVEVIVEGVRGIADPKQALAEMKAKGAALRHFPNK